jgi:hypothetical protein
LYLPFTFSILIICKREGMKENKKEENKGKQATGKVMSNYRK